jgi:hypothetical protein
MPRFQIINNSVEDSLLNKEEIYYLDPENDKDDYYFMIHCVTDKFTNGLYICLEIDDTGKTHIVKKRPVIHIDVYRKHISNTTEKKKSKSTYKPVYCEDCGLERGGLGFIRYDGEDYYHKCECY